MTINITQMTITNDKREIKAFQSQHAFETIVDCIIDRETNELAAAYVEKSINGGK